MKSHVSGLVTTPPMKAARKADMIHRYIRYCKEHYEIFVERAYMGRNLVRGIVLRN